MIFVRGLLDRLVLILAVIAGGSVPGFANQYRQQVAGRLDQVILDLAPFQQIADRYHQGDIQLLIQHHLNSSDATFYEEGRAIQSMVESAARLQEMAVALNTDIVHQLGYLMMHHDVQILDSTFQNFEPAFVITPDALMIAALTGLILWLLFLGTWKLSASAIGSLRKPGTLKG